MWGKVGVAASGAKRGRIYASIEALKGGLFVSEDYGDKWKHVSDDHKIRERAWYYSWVYADPKSADTVYVPNVYFHKSTDGGKSFGAVVTSHGDNHDLWIDPDDPRRMILGDDGGATITYNGGRTWSTQNNQPTAQFYRVTTDDQFPYWVYGSQQDNSNVAIPSGVAGGPGVDVMDWHPAGGGESGWIAPDPSDPQVVYAGEYGGQITRYDHRTRQARQIMAWPQLTSGRATKQLKYRFQWNAPILISPNDPKVLYHAAQKLLRSRDGGDTWEEISPDLTRNDPAKQGKSGGPITIDVTGVEVYDTIFALAESKLERGVIWAGTDDGLVHVTRDDGKSWQNVTPKGMPEWIQVNAIDLSAHEKGAAYVAATRYKFDDFHPYLYKTTDYGKTWSRIDRGIPDNAFTRVVREDPVRRGLLFAGTETGLYVSTDDGATWHPFQRNLPVVPITDLQVKNNDLVVATQGRSFWILDGLTALRKWTGSVAAEPAYLFAPQPAVRIQTYEPDEEYAWPPMGKNIPNGVVVDYWLKEKPGKTDKVTLEFLSGGKVIRTFSNEKPEPEARLKDQAAREEEEKEKDKPLEPKAGVNRFVWDMRVFKPTIAPKAVFNEGVKAPPKVGPGVLRGSSDRCRPDVDREIRGSAPPRRVFEAGGPEGAVRPARRDPRPDLGDSRDGARGPRPARPDEGPRRPSRADGEGERPEEARRGGGREAHRDRGEADESEHPVGRGRPQLRAEARSRLRLPGRNRGVRRREADEGGARLLRGAEGAARRGVARLQGGPRRRRRRVQPRGRGGEAAADRAGPEDRPVKSRGQVPKGPAPASVQNGRGYHRMRPSRACRSKNFSTSSGVTSP